MDTQKIAKDNKANRQEIIKPLASSRFSPLINACHKNGAEKENNSGEERADFSTANDYLAGGLYFSFYFPLSFIRPPIYAGGYYFIRDQNRNAKAKI